VNSYIYMFVRGDLSHPQQIVQTAHAVDEIGKRHKTEETSFMVLCDAKNEESLYNIAGYLKEKNIDHEMFYEPDIGECTAIATQPLRGEARSSMKRFQLKR
jgi:hypothetical protein